MLRLVAKLDGMRAALIHRPVDGVAHFLRPGLRAIGNHPRIWQAVVDHLHADQRKCKAGHHVAARRIGAADRADVNGLVDLGALGAWKTNVWWAYAASNATEKTAYTNIYLGR